MKKLKIKKSSEQKNNDEKQKIKGIIKEQKNNKNKGFQIQSSTFKVELRIRNLFY